MISLAHYLIVAAALFCLSVAGIFINRKNVILLLMCIELMLLAVNLNFIAFSHFNQDISGQVFVLPRRNPRLAWRFWWFCSAIAVLSMLKTSTPCAANGLVSATMKNLKSSDT